jgi:hypothetical protein
MRSSDDNKPTHATAVETPVPSEGLFLGRFGVHLGVHRKDRQQGSCALENRGTGVSEDVCNNSPSVST